MSTSSTGNQGLITARPLSVYKREPHVQELLETWDRLPARVLLHQITSAGAALDKSIPNEALVAAARAFLRRNASDEAWEIFKVLTARAAGRTYRHLSIWGIAGTSRQEDVTQDIVIMMMECVLSIEPQNEFWECRFWTCFDRRVRTLLRDLTHQQHNDLSWDDMVEGGASERQAGARPSTGAEWIENIAAQSLLERLPEPIRTAFYLKHYAGYKEESDEGGGPTIASTLGVTGRTVRNYLKRAGELLADWRRESKEKEDA